MKRPFIAIISFVFIVQSWIGLAHASEEYYEEDASQIVEEEGNYGSSDQDCLDYNYRVPDSDYDRTSEHRRPKSAAEKQECGAKSALDHLSFSVESDFLSQYIWRGQESSTGAVWQPSATVEFYGAGLTIWASFPMSDEPNQGEFNEVDFIPYYTISVHDLTITPSLEIYIYPNGDPRSLDYSPNSTFRASLHLSYPVWNFDFFSDSEIDLKQNKGAFFLDLGVGFHYRIIDQVSVNTSALFAMGNGRYSMAHFGVNGTKVNLFQFALSFPWNPWKKFTVKPTMKVSSIAAPSMRKVTNRPDIVSGGLELIYDF